MKTTDPAFWNELISTQDSKVPDEFDEVVEDQDVDTGADDADADDSELTMKTLIDIMVSNKLKPGVALRSPEGALMSARDADDIDFFVEPGNDAALEKRANEAIELDTINKGRVKHEVKDSENTTLRRGTRNKYPNKQYATEAFWRHHDEDSSDIDEI